MSLVHGRKPAGETQAEALSSAEVVYVDSRAALECARNKGLNPQAELRSFSPALLRESGQGLEQADAALTPRRIAELEDAQIRLSRGFREIFPEDEDLALIAARAALLQLHPLVAKAECLREEDFEKRMGIIRVTSRDLRLNEELDTPLVALLATNCPPAVFDVPIEEIHDAADPRPPAPDFWRRLSFSTLSTVLYRLLEKAVSALNLRGPRGTVLILRENENLKETAFRMACRGYFPRLMPLRRVQNAAALAAGDYAALEAKLRGAIEREFGPFFSPRKITAVSQVFTNIIAGQWARYRDSLPVWRQTLDGLAAHRPKAVFTNHLNDPELVGLHRVLRERDLPLISFQHGVTIEFNPRMRCYDALFDSAASDIEVMFNETGVAVSQAGAYCRGKSIAAGMPADYRRKGKIRGIGKPPPVWYISTALYLSNDGSLCEGVNDTDKADFELRIINEVLARQHHRVLYKPYPGRRYLDPDPVIAAASDAPNIMAFQRWIDLRYMIGSARLLITSRSFSTPSWCLMSGLPLIFIDIPEQTPLTPEARDAFAAGVFLIDAGAPDFHEKLRAFLDRPITEIECEWEAKAPAREELMRCFISSHEGAAGRRAAAAIAAEIEGREL